jgi:hypothetical protein
MYNGPNDHRDGYAVPSGRRSTRRNFLFASAGPAVVLAGAGAAAGAGAGAGTRAARPDAAGRPNQAGQQDAGKRSSDGVMNVVDFGADPAGHRDSTRSIQAAIDAIDLHTGGTVYFPNGTYLVNGPLRTENGYNARLALPYIPVGATGSSRAQSITIEFRGETFPVIAQPEQENTAKPLPVGAVLLCTVAGSGADPCILGGPSATTAKDSTAIFPVVRNLTFRETAPATHVACDFTMCVNADIANCSADIDALISSSLTPATRTASGGFFYPPSHTDGPAYVNYAENNLDRCYVLGRGTAVRHGSHLDIDRLFSQFCYATLVVQNAGHAVRAGKILSQYCTYDVYVAATAQPVPRLDIQTMDIEAPAASSRVHDPANLLYGQIVFHDRSLDDAYVRADGALNITLLKLSALRPSVAAATAGTAGRNVQNVLGAPLTLLQETVLNPTQAAGASVTPYLGPTTDSMVSLPGLSAPAGAQKGIGLVSDIKVPAGWWWRFETVNAVAGAGWPARRVGGMRPTPTARRPSR